MGLYTLLACVCMCVFVGVLQNWRDWTVGRFERSKAIKNNSLISSSLQRMADEEALSENAKSKVS